MLDYLKNWKTTTAGGVPALAVIFQQLSIACDADPATSVSYPVLALAVGALFHAIFSKDK